MALTSDPIELLAAARSGDKRSLARLITMVENDPDSMRPLLATIFPSTGGAFVTGITSAPGAGKSTLTDGLIRQARGSSEVAVLAVDPSSPFTGGAILGDRVRMQEHIDDAGVYIRSMASRGHLGGISQATPRALTLLDALGFAELFVETVGVGQAEVEIMRNADTIVVVVNPRWGDAVQAAKAGLLEIGDVFVVNKADRPGVEDTMRDLKQMLELGGHRPWWPPVVATVAVNGEGLEDLWGAIQDHRRHLQQSGELEQRRQERLAGYLEAALASAVRDRIRDELGAARLTALIEAVTRREIDPWSAAADLLSGH